MDDLDFAPRGEPEHRAPGPNHGWRRIVYKATFGLVNPGPSAGEKQDTAYEATIGATLRGNYKVGVLGKGGVGKTTVAASVGSIFAELRRQDRVVAIGRHRVRSARQQNRPADQRLVLGNRR